jgi:hypothetical protein
MAKKREKGKMGKEKKRKLVMNERGNIQGKKEYKFRFKKRSGRLFKVEKVYREERDKRKEKGNRKKNERGKDYDHVFKYK